MKYRNNHHVIYGQNPHPLFLILCLSLLFAFVPAKANERKFTYVYETSVLAPGMRELEVWNTYRSERTYFFRQLDQSIELEFGIVDRLMGALYLNYEWNARDSNGDEPGGTMLHEQAANISTEMKYKLLDRVADPLGMAVYGEFTLGPDETEAEEKLILDTQFGDLLAATNIVLEQEWDTNLEDGVIRNSREWKLELDAGLSYSLTRQLSLGVELVQQNMFDQGEGENAALFLGPVVSYTGEQWWATWTFLPQVAGFAGSSGRPLNLNEFEKMQTRLMVSFHL